MSKHLLSGYVGKRLQMERIPKRGSHLLSSDGSSLTMSTEVIKIEICG